MYVSVFVWSSLQIDTCFLNEGLTKFPQFSHLITCNESFNPLSVFIFQVKQLVDEELFARYDRLLLQSSLDLMADVVYCPRLSCGTAVMVEPDTTMGICSACQYAFCTLCKLGYHGLSNCKIPAGNVSVVISALNRSTSTAIQILYSYIFEIPL